MDRRRPTTESTGVPAHIGADSPSIPSLHLDRDFVAQTSVGERLAQLEEQIVTAVKRDLCFDHFEIRLRSPGSQRLELVISENLSPMRIGESISACETGNGISGWVAATGQILSLWRCQTRCFVQGGSRRRPKFVDRPPARPRTSHRRIQY